MVQYDKGVYTESEDHKVIIGVGMSVAESVRLRVSLNLVRGSRGQLRHAPPCSALAAP